MTLSKIASIVTAYAASLEAAGSANSAQQLAALAVALKAKGRMDVAMLSRILKAQR